MRNTASKLAQFLTSDYKAVYGVSKNSLVYAAIADLANGVTNEPGKVSAASSTGSGRFSRVNDFSEDLSRVLSALGIGHEIGNDAPRGGAHGKFVRITVKSFVAERSAAIAEYKAAEAKRIAKEKAKAAMEAATEAALRAHRNECTYNKAMGLLPSFSFDWDAFKVQISGCRKAEKAAWWQLSQALGVANNDGLKKAVRESCLA